MGRVKEDDKELDPIPIASPRDLENFSKQRISPSVSYFRLDVAGTRRSPWNKALTTAFGRCFIGSTWYNGESTELIKTAFSVHLQTLIKNWKAQQRKSAVDVQDDDDLQKELNSDQRRRSVRVFMGSDPFVLSLTRDFSSGRGGTKRQRLAMNFHVLPRLSKTLV